MALAVWQSTIVNRSGDVQPNAQVEVRLESSGALAAIYADRDGNIPLDNPFNADENGFARFYAAGGAYKITASLGSFSQTYRHVAIGLLGEQDQISGDQLSGVLAHQGRIGHGADLNTYTTTGIWHQNLNAYAESGTNYPVPLAGMLRVYADDNMVYQEYFAYATGATYIRKYYFETWYPWYQVYDSGHPPSFGDVAVDGTLTINAGGPALSLKPGSQDRTFIEFYADSDNPNNRSAYFGFAFAGTSRISLVNEMAGDIYFQTGGQIIFQAPTIAVQGRGGVLHHGDTALTSGRVFVRQGGSPVGFLEGDITIIW